MKRIILLAVLIISTSCASNYKSKLAGSIAGVLIGGWAGSVIAKETSPNIESQDLNVAIGVGTGILVGGFSGYQLGNALYKDNPENFEGREIEIKNIRQSRPSQVSLKDPKKLNFSDLRIELSDNLPDIYKDEVTKEVPKELRGMVRNQYVIEHKVPTQKFQTEDGKTIIIKETTAIEHTYAE